MKAKLFPEIAPLSPTVRSQLLELTAFMQTLGVQDSSLETDFYIPLAQWVLARQQEHQGLYVLGISGGQGAGKTTMARILEFILKKGFGLRVAHLSIDDLYLTRSERQGLAQTSHSLFATRGVPGTHDVALGSTLIHQLERSDGHVELPIFNKAIDDRSEQSIQVTAPIDVLIFEGWCVGARAQSKEALTAPINRLEQEQDPQGLWRSEVNRQLADVYPRLFGRLDDLIFLAVPGMDQVVSWRQKQERQLTKGDQIMDEQRIVRFIEYFERISRHMLETMPELATLTFYLDQNQRITRIWRN